MKQKFVCALAVVTAIVGAAPGALAASDIVTYAAAGTPHGNWTAASCPSAAGGACMSSPDSGWSKTDAPLAAPTNYFEITVNAAAGTPYRIWLRMQASSNSKWNDSVWVQFSDAIDSGGAALDRIGSTSGLLVNLAADSTGAGLSGWGWQNGAYWISQQTVIQLAGSGTHTIQVQTREDGVQIDQIVLSPSTYLNSAPGGVANDGTILLASGGSTSGTSSLTLTSAVTASALTVSGGAASIPGTIQAEDFDNGGSGVSYHDSTPGNNGGAYRSTDVDIEPSSEGGYDVGWIAGGEWLNYTVNVSSAGSYTVGLRMASLYGGSLHLGFGGSGSNVWTSVSIPATGGWQNWTTVNVPVTLAAGSQMMTVLFDTGGVNFNAATVSGGSASSGGSGATSGAGLAYGGTPRGLPGTVEAEDFDTGGAGVSFGDSTSGNSGGQYRQTDVDIESASGGGYDIGWTAAGEFLNYTVNVASSGSYTVRLHVASPYGGSLHFGLGAPSNVWTGVFVPPTGGWQSWTDVSLPVTLAAGTQLMTLKFDTGGFNLDRVAVDTGSTTTTSSGGSSSGGSTDVPVFTWNIQINDGSDAHARLVMDMALATSPRPQVITIQEAYLQHFNTYIDELQRQTGQTWHGVFATHCAAGQWNGSSCNSQWDQGIGIFTTYDIVDSSSTYFPFPDCWTSARVSLRAALNVNGKILQVFTNHLQTGNCSDVVSQRHQAITMFKSWAANYSNPQIVSGDFNADPNEIDTTANMGSAFRDTWPGLGSGYGATAFAPSPQYKIDYWFENLSGGIAAVSTEVDYNTSTISDHLPVRAVFRMQ